MLTSLNIRNFKCFSEVNIDFSNLTVLAGSNASGKSSVIQALLFYAYTMETHENHIDIRKIYDLDQGLVKDLFSQNPAGSDGNIEIGATTDGMSSGISLKTSNKSPYVVDVSRTSPPKKNLQITYLRAERVGPRTATPISDSPDNLGYSGEYTPSVIENADKIGIKVHEKLLDRDNNIKFSAQIERWMSAIIGKMEIDIITDYSKGYTDTKIKNPTTDFSVIPTLTGFGITYAMPIIAASLLCSARPESVLVVENPEAHLHPMAQSNIGKFLAILSQCGVQVIIETHSEHVVDGARIQLRNDNLTEMMIINFFEVQKKKIAIKPITLERNGELAYWPKGFFDQKQTDLRELLYR